MRKDKKIKKIFKWGIIFCLLFFVSVVLINLEVKYKYSKYILAEDNDVTAYTAIVLGARVYRDETLSHVYQDRVQTALELYQDGRVEKLLISGDHGRKEYDKVNAAKDYLLEHGVESQDIFMDHAGFDTYDSMYRARDIFQVEDAIIVTQEFHLPRALYIARKLGLDAYGINADKRVYLNVLRNDIRESLARAKAFVNIVLKSKPKYLGELIPITGDGHVTWD